MLKKDTKNSIVNTLNKLIFGFLVVMALLLANSNIGVRNAAYIILILIFLKFLINPTPIKIQYNRDIIFSLIIFYIVTFSVSIFSLNPQASFYRIYTNFILPVIPLFLFSNLIKNKRQLIIILVALAISILISDIVTIWKWLYGIGIRRASIFANPLEFGSVATLLLPLFLIGTLDKINLNGKLRKIFLVTFILTVLALIFNGSRGAWLASSLVLVSYILINHRDNKKVLGSVIIFGFLFLTLTIIFPEIKTRLFSIFNMQVRSNSERILMWQSALKMIADYPVFGIGLDNFYVMYNNFYISPLAYYKNLFAHAHNLFLQHFVDTGIFGFTALMYLFFTILKTLWKGAKEFYQEKYLFIGVFLGIISMLLVGLTDHLLAYLVILRLFWALIGICLAVSFWSGPTSKYEE